METNMLKVLYGLILTLYAKNLNCFNDSCTSCLSEYLNYQDTSCLRYCPSGYKALTNDCFIESGLDLFTLDALNFQVFNATSIEEFSHPNKIKFNDSSKLAPTSTKSRGLFFSNSSYLESSTSWVIAPSFCLSIVYKVFDYGTIFEVKDQNLYFSLTYQTNISITYRLENNAGPNQKIIIIKPGIGWMNTIITFVQRKGLITIYSPVGELNLYGFEFRMDSNVSLFSLGSRTVSFKGFLSYLCMKNSGECSLKPSPFDTCTILSYFDEESHSCQKCPSNCSGSGRCIDSTCSPCHSSICTDCFGYLPDHCTSCSEVNNPLCTIGKSCLTRAGFECLSCDSNLKLSKGLCINKPSNFNILILSMSVFSQYQGEIFQSGANESTFSPYNNPESDDPIALSFRGYYFNTSLFMISSNITLNSEFTVAVWAKASNHYLIYCDKFQLSHEGSISIILNNADDFKLLTVHGECFQYSWKFLAVQMFYENLKTHFKLFCNEKLKKEYSVQGYAFYDASSKMNITTHYNTDLFVYKIVLAQSVIPTHTIFNCTGCLELGILDNSTKLMYWNKRINNYLNCNSSCINGCSRWGSCNQCKDINCLKCGSFDTDNCSVYYNETKPCLDGLILRDTNCCDTRCLTCFGQHPYMCFSCEPGYKRFDNFCTLQCPTGYKEDSQGQCIIISTSGNLLEATFDVIQDNFTDMMNNSFYTGNDSKFYPEPGPHDPIPAKSRGFYFNGSSVVRTSNVSIGIKGTIGFWIRQNQPGLLLSKNNLAIYSNFSIKFGKNSLSYPHLVNQTWMIICINSFIYFDFFRIRIQSQFQDFPEKLTTIVFDDPASNITLGDYSQGFQGFIYKFFLNPLASMTESDDYRKQYWNFIPIWNLWNSSINQYLDQDQNVSCDSRCPYGCIKNTSCNLCLDPLCYECQKFDSSCLRCSQNSYLDQICKCVQSFYLTEDSTICKSCPILCQNCSNSTNCFSCKENSTLTNESCFCKSGFFLSGQSCLGCHKDCLECSGPLENNCILCSSPREISSGYCRCPLNTFWTGSECLNCTLGTFFMNNSCVNCNPTCRSCFDGSESGCSSCNANAFLENSTCNCYSSFYQKNGSCDPCDAKCEECSGPGPSNCLCRSSEGWKLCSCPRDTFLDKTCIDCDRSCLSCSGKTYFECTDCSNHILAGMCFGSCPRGYDARQQECRVSMKVSFSLLFDGLDLQDLQANPTLCQQPGGNLPVLSHRRGIYFENQSACISVDGKNTPFVAPVFFISVWLRAQLYSSIFEIRSDQKFYVRLRVEEKVIFHVGNFEEVEIFGKGFDYFQWQHVSLNFEYSTNTIMTLKVNQETIQSKSSKFPYKDTTESLIYFGKNNESPFFIYLFQIFTSEAGISELFSEKADKCLLAPSSLQTCLSLCEVNQFISNELCMDCPNFCQKTCVNDTTCAICEEFACSTCKNETFCMNCKEGYELHSGKCQKCLKNEFFFNSKCEKCPDLCETCENNSECLNCSENSYMQGFLCECFEGFERINGTCLRMTFNASISVSFDNQISFFFDEKLEKNLTVEDISVIFQSKVMKFSIIESSTLKSRIQLIFDKQFDEKGEDFAFIKLSDDLRSVEKSFILKNSFTVKLYLDNLKNTINKKSSIQAKNKQIIQVSTSVAVSSSLLTFNPTSFFNFLNLVELFSYSMLYDIEFHENLYEFMNDLKSTTKLPTLELPIDSNSKKIPERFKKFGIDSSLVCINGGFMIILVLLSFLLLAAAEAGKWSRFEKVERISKFFKEKVFFYWISRCFIQGCFDFMIFVFIGVNFSEFQSSYEKLDIAVCAFVGVRNRQAFLSFGLYLACSALVRVDFPVSVLEIKRSYFKYTCFLQEFDCSEKKKCFFYIIFIVRRTATSIGIFYMNFVFQLYMSLIFAFAVIFNQNLLYLCLLFPFSKKRINYYTIFNEVILIVFYIILLLKELKILKLSLLYSSDLIINIILSALIFNVVTSLLDLSLELFNLLKSKCKSKESKVEPYEHITSVQKL